MIYTRSAAFVLLSVIFLTGVEKCDACRGKEQKNNKLPELLGAIKALSRARFEKLNGIDDNIDRQLSQMKNTLGQYIMNFKQQLETTEGLREKFIGALKQSDEKVKSLVLKAIDHTGSLGDELYEMNSELQNDLTVFLAEMAAGTPDVFGAFSDGIDIQNKQLNELRKNTQLVSDSFGKFTSERVEVDRQYSKMEDDVASIASTLREANRTLVGEVAEKLSVAVLLLENTMGDVKASHDLIDRKLGQLLTNNDRLMLVASFQKVFQRFNQLIRRHRHLASNDSSSEKRQLWIKMVTEGDRYGMSMQEILFNFDLMIMGYSRVFQMRSVLDWYMEASISVLDDYGGASQGYFMSYIVEELVAMQRLGYDLLQKALVMKDQQDEALRVQMQADFTLGQQKALFMRYLNAADFSMHISKVSYNSERVKVGSYIQEVDAYINSTELSRRNLPLLGCRLCQGGCGTMGIDGNSLSVQCKFADEGPTTPAGTDNQQTPVERVYPASLDDINSQRVGHFRNLNYPSNLTFVAMQFVVVNDEDHAICGMRLRQVEHPTRRSTRVLKLGVDVCEFSTMKWVASSDGDCPTQHIAFVACSSSSDIQVSSWTQENLIEAADSTSTTWNSLTVRGRAKITGLGLCSDEIRVEGASDRRAFQRVLKLKFNCARA